MLARRIDRELTAGFDRALMAKAGSLATLMKVEPLSPIGLEFDFADEFMPEFEAEVNPEYFQLWLADGRLIERSNALGRDQDLPKRPPSGGWEHFEDCLLYTSPSPRDS